MKKSYLLFVIILLAMMNLSAISVNANESDKESDELVQLYSDSSLEESVLELPLDSIVSLVKILEDDEILKVEYDPNQHIGDEILEDDSTENERNVEFSQKDDEELPIEGYLHKDDLEKDQEFEIGEPLTIYSTENEDDTVGDADQPEESNVNGISEDDEPEAEAENPNSGEEKPSFRTMSMGKPKATSSSTPAPLETFFGVALKKVKVYSEQKKSSKTLKSYAKGSILKYKGHDDSVWYKATVKVNGKWKSGYINSSDVESATNHQKTIRGIGLKNKTHVYKKASTSSGSWKSYSQGTLLKYKTYTSGWYEATVKVGEKWETGYIHKSHVEEPTSKQKTLRGIGTKAPTRVYKKASTSSGTWKSYSQGTLLKYKTYTKNWYEATVRAGGKWQTGYIHKSHVEEPTSDQKTLYGIGLRTKTPVYSKASTSSKRLKSYSVGSKLKYKTYTKNWYEAVVMVKGKWQTGYIHKSHVDEPINHNKTIHGIGLKNKTHVYSEASTAGKKLKSYAQGSLLKFRTFTKNWYKATVRSKGKWRTGYIHKSHVEESVEKQITAKGIAQKNKTHVYQRASTSSKKLKSYNQGHVLKYKSFVNNWYEAKVKISGKYVTGFIHHSHVASDLLEYTDYKITLEKAIDIQRKETNKFSRSQYRKYMDPSKNDNFQHLRLDTSVGVTASQLNKVLSGKGILDGKGQNFINGAKQHGVNEAYLIAHAILETGHGGSKLAKGIDVGLNDENKPVMVTSKNKKNLTKIKTTYNMFGIGAVNKCPEKCGSEYAYNQGWFSPSKAIEGGAAWIANQYIQNGYNQNTLYKMKWNPKMYDGAAWKQYATDAGWAVKQTSFIKNIYNQVKDPIYHYDVAKYQ